MPDEIQERERILVQQLVVGWEHCIWREERKKFGCLAYAVRGQGMGDFLCSDYFLFSLGPGPTEWCCPPVGRVFSPHELILELSSV